jgi:hypothetical protein
MSLEIDKKYFWDHKILGWEKKNYNGMLWGSAIRQRRDLFLSVAGSSLKNKVVFESGCGSAGLVEDLFELGIKKYIGCDLSAVAIQKAKISAARLGLALKTEFLNQCALKVENISCDLNFSLGLWDWLDNDEVTLMMQKTKASSYLHSYSELRHSPSQLLHRMYVFTSYGRKNVAYTPKYRMPEQIAGLMKSAGAPEPKFFRKSSMSFSTFAYYLES